MARAGFRANGMQKIEGDEVEKSLEILDKVLSEFEDPDSLPHIEPESPSQGNQSEDDGYMSMNGRRAKIPPDFHQASDESSASPPIMPPTPTIPTDTEGGGKSPPPPPEVAEAIISNLLPRVSPTKINTGVPPHINDGSGVNEESILVNNIKHRSQGVHGAVPGSGSGSSSQPNATSLLTKFTFKNLNGAERQGIHPAGSGVHDSSRIIPPTGLVGLGISGAVPESSIAPAQTTLPKTRPSTVIPSRYSSLPCSGPARSFGSFDGIGVKGMNGGSFDGGRNILGMGISAVHDAVLRGGVARLPEPIVNEHPVTIYPGRASPPRGRVPPRTLPGSIERHREVCRNLNSNDDDSNQSMSSSSSSSSSSTNHQRLGVVKSPSSPLVIVQQLHSHNANHSSISNSFSSNQLIDNKNLLNNLQIPSRKRHGNGNGDGRKGSSESEEFSDDSLEGQSLPPPPPPPVVPPPPSLSAPVTPSKRGSIAWEINLDDHLPPPPPSSQAHQQHSGAAASSRKGKSKHDSTGSTQAKIITRRRGRSVSGSQSSLASTPGNSGGSVSNNRSPHHEFRQRSGSVEWPEPPDPPVCSTEDEAASLYSDSDDILPTYPTNMTGHGTYVIRKGRKERHRLQDINNSMSSSINSRLSSDGNLVGVTQANNLLIPNSRHSIDLGSSPHGSNLQSNLQNSVLSPRSRLSLDLSSPNSTSELPQIASNAITNSVPNQSHQNISPRYNDFKTYATYDGIQALESNGNGHIQISSSLGSNNSLNNNNSNNHNNNISNNITNNPNSSNTNSIGNGPLSRVASLPGGVVQQQQTTQNDVISTTPRRELAPPIEEDEEQDSESQRGAPLRQIENNISALLRGDISVARVGDISHPRRPLGFRPGVHKSESAKEMLLSQQNTFGPLPPSPPSSSPEPEIDGFPPLPPSPQENAADDEDDTEDVLRGLHGIRINSRTRLKNDIIHFPRDSTDHPPAVPPHRGQPSINTLKTRSMDAGYTKKYSSNSAPHGGGPGTLPGELPGTNTRRRLMSGAFQKRSAQSPREERRLQTSCSLPETPIFARGCDIPRTPHRRAPEAPNGGSRTAPRTNTTASLNSSIVGIGSTLGGGRQRSISQALASGEMLRLAGGPARGWYPKQRTQRPASTEHLDRLHRSQGSMRAWDSSGMNAASGNRKPLTLPPNLTPKFFNKSPREALRRVTSLLIRKGNGKDKESKRDKEALSTSAVHRSPGSAGDVTTGQTTNGNNNSNHQHKKKGFFKSFWKKSKHYSLEQ